MDTSDDDVCQLRRSIGEPAAFRSVFERHHPAVPRYLHHRVRDVGLAEDLAGAVGDRP